jgi:hypothetical protein
LCERKSEAMGEAHHHKIPGRLFDGTEYRRKKKKERVYDEALLKRTMVSVPDEYYDPSFGLNATYMTDLSARGAGTLSLPVPDRRFWKKYERYRKQLVSELIHMKFSMCEDWKCVFLALMILDRYFSHEEKIDDCNDCVMYAMACAAFILATKMVSEEGTDPEDASYLYKLEAGLISDCETRICKVLSFDLNSSTAFDFIIGSKTWGEDQVSLLWLNFALTYALIASCSLEIQFGYEQSVIAEAALIASFEDITMVCYRPLQLGCVDECKERISEMMRLKHRSKEIPKTLRSYFRSLWNHFRPVFRPQTGAEKADGC